MPQDQILIGTSTPENLYDLVSFADAVVMLPGLSPKQLAALPAAITAATEAVRDWCRRDFALDQRDEYLDGDGSTSQFVEHFPIFALYAVIVGEGDDAETLDPSEYSVSKRTGEVRLRRRAFPEGFANVRVQYAGGPSTVPFPVVQATVQAAKALIDQAGRDTTVDSERWLDYSWSRNQVRKDSGIPETAKDLLAPYRSYRA